MNLYNQGASTKEERLKMLMNQKDKLKEEINNKKETMKFLDYKISLYKESKKMKKQTAGHDALGDFAPDFAHYNDDVLFGEVWNDTKLDLKTRSIITISTLIGKGILDSSLKYHLQNAKNNGVTKEEMADLGIFASTDPVALDQACYDAVKNATDPGKKALIERMDSKHAIHTIEAASEHGLGNRQYEIVNLSKQLHFLLVCYII